VLGGGRSFEIGGESSEIKGRLFGTGGVETSEIDKEESSGLRDCPSGKSRIWSVIMTKEEEMSSSAGRDCMRPKEMVISRYPG
jgi:hypothetical protein